MVGFGTEENDSPEEDCRQMEEDEEEEDCRVEECCNSSYGEVSKLTLLPISPKMAGSTAIIDIPAFTHSLPLFPYHKILQ